MDKIDIEMLRPYFNVIIATLQYLLFPLALYHLVISVFGWVKRKDKPASEFKPVNRFAIVIAAHNEERVIGNIVRNLKELNYPKDLYDIFVIADNCDDNTARIARENGAVVYERFNQVKKGKGYALEWMFEKIFRMNKKYDAICVFDADNLVSRNFLLEMNKHLCMGHKVIQGYLDSKNPRDSLVAGSNSITFWINNRLFQLARYYLGLSCAIGGTGFVVSTDLLKDIGWGATSLTEDLEFTVKLVLKGHKVYWSHEAVVYDEKPITMAQSWRQRRRWMQGQADCAERYFKKLLVKAFKDKSLVAFDMALYLIQPVIIVISGMGFIANILRFFLFFNLEDFMKAGSLESGLVMFIVTYISIIVIFAEGKITRKNLKIIAYFLVFPLYNLTWIPIIIQGFKDRKKKEWTHTLHTRSMDITELEELRT